MTLPRGTHRPASPLVRDALMQAIPHTVTSQTDQPHWLTGIILHLSNSSDFNDWYRKMFLWSLAHAKSRVISEVAASLARCNKLSEVYTPQSLPANEVSTPLPVPASPPQMSPPKRRKAEPLPDQAREILQAWMFAHMDAPYPSASDKLELAQQSGLTVHQVGLFCTNMRKRQLHFKSLADDAAFTRTEDRVHCMRHLLQRSQPRQTT
eukprot:TRINITY_DN7186_c0_g1_i1.p1 TRINITY_DN7186_c0_g1~~TRINITY_DN7186_c0_g1_i1.p1  ORF type:complete len:208 (+),score=6.77 TRINITY_DN7186_c0_g1_i1:94-717(+)